MILILFNVISEEEIDLINKIFSKTNVKMYNISFDILRNRIDAEEAVSEAFLKIIENIDKISSLPCPKIEPYCVVILKNETMNIFRKTKKTIQVEDIDRFNNNRSNDPEKKYMEFEDKETLLSHVKKLSDIDKNFIHLRFVHEMQYREIAEILRISEEAARKRNQRILKKLELYYEEGDSSVKNR